METDNDARIMHAHFADAENEMQHPIMLGKLTLMSS